MSDELAHPKRFLFGNSFQNIVEAWDVLNMNVIECGEKVSPRGKPTIELHNVTYDYNGRNHQYTFINPVRKFPAVYWLVELFYFLNKRDDDLRENYIKGTSKYKNPSTNRYDGSYEELGRWLPHVINVLQKDPETRRAVLTTLRYDHITNADRTEDFPCNDLFGFRIREGALDMNVVTRSQDLYIGWIMNTLCFTLLQTMLAKALKLDIGTYCHHIFSLHLYEKDIEKAKASIGQTERDSWKPNFSSDYNVEKFWKTVRTVGGASEFPELFGSQYYVFDNDIVHALQIARFPDKKIQPVGGFSSWAKRWMDEKK